MTTILATIFVFGIIVFIHELGHFITAKLCGMRVDEFAVGFGPALTKTRRGETLYSIRAIPLGGYNKIAGMDPEEPVDDRSFLSKPVWKRFIVISAGAVFNFLLAIVMFFLVFAFFGVMTPSNEPTIGRIMSGSPAAAAHLEVNDRFVTINNQPVTEWKNITEYLNGHANEVISVTVDRNGQKVDASVIPQDNGNGRAVIGINPVNDVQRYGVVESAKMAVTGTFRIIYEMVGGLWAMITGTTRAEVAGPIGVAQMAGEIAAAGFVYLLQFTAILSINLGVINLLPIPVLDGGHLIMLIYEGITRRRLPPKALYYIQMAGMAILLFIFIYATSSDLSRL